MALRPCKAPSDAQTVTSPLEVVDTVDTSSLERLTGYNARRAALAVIGEVISGMEPFGLQRSFDYFVLTLISHNPGITSRQLCDTLDISPPNLVGIIKNHDKRGLVERRDHPTDRRAHGLYLTGAGTALHKQAEKVVKNVDMEVANQLTQLERDMLISLLRKLYIKTI